MVVKECLLSIVSASNLVDLDSECADLLCLESLLCCLIRHKVLNLYPEK